MWNILHCHYLEHASVMHSELNLLPLEVRRKFHCLNETYKIVHGLSPKYLMNEYTLVCDVHSRTQGSNTLRLYNTECRLECANRNFVYRLVVLWNRLPEHIKQAPNLAASKSLVLEMLKAELVNGMP